MRLRRMPPATQDGVELLGAPLLDNSPNPQIPWKASPMPFTTIGKEKLDAKIDLRLPAEEKARIAEEAQIAGISKSALVRRRYFGRPIVAHADLATIRELRRLGGLLKQIHKESGGAYSSETYTALLNIKAAIIRLARAPSAPT